MGEIILLQQLECQRLDGGVLQSAVLAYAEAKLDGHFFLRKLLFVAQL